MKKLLVCLFVACSILSYGQLALNLTDKIPFDPAVRTGKLPNGITYFIRKNAKPEKRAELRIAINAGSCQENDSQQGLAHFCEHMCFNGTKNFKKSALIDYLESVGTKFGPHLNAYTSFDETVYMIQIPTDKDEILYKGVDILNDWATNVSFDNEEIDKERGVVTEEWRLGQGANERMRNKYWPILFKGSRYENRLPIGKPEILKNCKYDTLKKFYADWYRPDLMAVIAVGDFDMDKMEKTIKEKFSAIPVKQNPRKRETYTVPDHDEMRIGKATDKEASYTAIQLLYKHPVEKMVTVADGRKYIMQQLYSSMLNQRFAELQQQANPPFMFASAYFGDMVREKGSYGTYAVVNEKGIERGLKTIIEENEKVKKFGFTASEFDRAKKAHMRELEEQFNERDKTESANFAGEYVQYFLTQLPSPGIAYEYEASKKLIDGITLDEVRSLANKYITDGKNCGIIITAPEKEGVVLPSDERIKAIFDEVKKSQLQAYEDKMVDKPLISNLASAGKIVKEEQIKELGITVLTLSNGIKVELKSTDFKNDEILFNAYSWGGTSLVNDKDYLSAAMASQIIDNSGLGEYDNVSLSKFMTGKVVGATPSISEFEQGLNGMAAPQDLETMFQLIYSYFTQPRKDQTAYEAYMAQQVGFLQNRSASPNAAYQDTIQSVMNKYHYRSRPMTEALLKEVNLDRAFEIYKERFADASGFKFFFVGNFKMDVMKSFIEKYIASLPATNKKETWKDLGVRAPKGLVTRTVKKGTEPKANVMLRFTGDFTFTRNDRRELSALTKLVSIKLRENLREDKGGTYGVGAYGIPKYLPAPSYDFVVNFGCGPDKVELLTSETLKEIEGIKANGCDDKNLVKIKETLKREFEVGLKENNYWLNYMNSTEKYNENLLDINNYTAWVDSINSNMIKAMANKIFNMNNYAKFILVPEK